MVVPAGVPTLRVMAGDSAVLVTLEVPARDVAAPGVPATTARTGGEAASAALIAAVLILIGVILITAVRIRLERFYA